MKKAEGDLKYSDLMGEWLLAMGYTHCFMVAGGGCMHLINGFRKHFVCVPVVHEVAAGIAAEHFNECSQTGKAFALVTTGPGLTNIITAIAGCYVERRELLVIAGQVKSSDLAVPPLRQRGIQETDGMGITTAITVCNAQIRNPVPLSEFQSIVRRSILPHPGPVMIEVCLDAQGAPVNRSLLEDTVIDREAPKVSAAETVAIHALVDEIRQARRPILLLGGLVARETVWDRLKRLEELGIPVMTTTSAVDRIPTSSGIFAGRPGTWGGQRAANMLIAQADVVVAIGAQLDLQQTGFNWREFTPQARLYQVYPCDTELAKGHPLLTRGFNANPDRFFEGLLSGLVWQDSAGWSDYVHEVRRIVPVLEPANRNREKYVCPFRFMNNLSRSTRPSDVLAVSSSGGSFTGALQVYEVAAHQYVTTSPAFASMGYGLSTAIGAGLARPGSRVILVEGDGGFAQNLQELALVRIHNLPVKIFILANEGYGSIRATQRKFFGGAYVGCDQETGLGFPDWLKLFEAYNIEARWLEPSEIHPFSLDRMLESEEPGAWIVPVDPEQTNWPAVSSRILPDGKMESNPLYQMVPDLDASTMEMIGKYLPK